MRTPITEEDIQFYRALYRKRATQHSSATTAEFEQFVRRTMEIIAK